MVGQGAIGFARGEGGGLLVAPAGPLRATLKLRGVGALADDGNRTDASGGAQARAAVAAPLARGFASGDTGDPWVHTTEPRMELAALATHAGEILPLARGMAAPDGGAWVAAGGWSNSVGRWGSRTSADVDVIAGAVGGAGRARPALRGRVEASGGWWSLEADAARVQDGGAVGGALLTRGRLGPASGLHLSVHAEERDGTDPDRREGAGRRAPRAGERLPRGRGLDGGAGAGRRSGAASPSRGAPTGTSRRAEVVDARGSIELHDHVRLRGAAGDGRASHRARRRGRLGLGGPAGGESLSAQVGPSFETM